MKLPKTLPPLAEPFFVLANPVAVQVGVLLAIAAAALAGGAWAIAQFLAGQGDAWKAAAIALSLIALSAVFYPRNWRRWVTFAADPQGIYLGRFQGDFVFVPWADVGPSEIGIAGRGSNRQRTVILPLRLDAAAFERLLGKYQKRAQRTADADGFLPYGIGNAMQDVEETKRRIEGVRAVALRK